VRYLADKDFSHDYQQLGKLDVPVQLLWGKEDQTLPFQDSEIICSAVPELEFHAFEHTGHLAHYEQPENVNALLRKFNQRAFNEV
jgi:pimeloyl-ACP methyl ester carboxylesterase